MMDRRGSCKCYSYREMRSQLPFDKKIDLGRFLGIDASPTELDGDRSLMTLAINSTTDASKVCAATPAIVRHKPQLKSYGNPTYRVVDTILAPTPQAASQPSLLPIIGIRPQSYNDYSLTNSIVHRQGPA